MTDKKKEAAGGQPLLETSIKALYVAAGVTDVLAEQLKEYAEHKQTAARIKREKRAEQIVQASELARELPKRAQSLVSEAPGMAKDLPAQVQEQLEALLKELNLGFEEMASRGEQRISEVRQTAAATTRRTARRAGQSVDEAQDDIMDRAEQVADIVESDDADSALHDDLTDAGDGVDTVLGSGDASEVTEPVAPAAPKKAAPRRAAKVTTKKPSTPVAEAKESAADNGPVPTPDEKAATAPAAKAKAPAKKAAKRTPAKRAAKAPGSKPPVVTDEATKPTPQAPTAPKTQP